MRQRGKVIPVFASVALVLTLSLRGSVEASPTATPRQEGYTLSAEALAAAGRFKGSEGKRLYADIELVIKELQIAGGAAAAAGQVEYRPISRRQLLDLLGRPALDSEKGEVDYGHNYGFTQFDFEGDRLKNVTTVSEPIYWYAYPRQSAAKRAWGRVVRWSRRLKGLLF